MAHDKRGYLIANRFYVHQVLMGGMGKVYLGYDRKSCQRIRGAD